MTHLLNLDDYPLKEPSMLSAYETFCRNLDVINDNDMELMTAHIRYCLKKKSGSNIEKSFLSEAICRKVENDHDINLLKEVLCYLERFHLYEKENAQDTPPTGTDPLTS